MLLRLLESFGDLLFPKLCVACGRHAPSTQSCFCYPCQHNIESTNMHLTTENEFTSRFWGRLPLKTGAAMYRFSKKGPVQRAIHQLKYRRKPEVGTKIGRVFGQLLAKSPAFQGIELIVPVPLNPRKERIRGYNQSAQFAQGLAEGMNVRWSADALERPLFSESQTHKSREERFRSVTTAFAVRKPDLLAGKKILLVDDVLTTGATLEYCGKLLLELPKTELYMATIAIAVKKTF